MLGNDVRILPGMPLLPLLAAFVAGVIVAHYSPGYLIYGAALLAALCFCAWLGGWRKVAVAGLFAVIGGVAMMIATPGRPDFDREDAPGAYVGFVEEISDSPYNQRIVAKVDAGVCVFSVLVYYHDVLPVIREGDVIMFAGALRPVGEEAVVPDEFSMSGFAARRGVTAQCHVQPGGVEVTGHKASLPAFFAGMRRNLSDYIHCRSGLGSGAAGMLDAMLTGDASAFGRERRDVFADAGLAHVLALSGTHVAVIAFMVSMLFFPLRMAGHRRWEPVCIIAVLWGYVLLAGCIPSVVRAAIMVSVVGFGRAFRRGSNSLNNLCLAALLILLFDPMALFAPGFQLSFAAVAAILMFPFALFVKGNVAWPVRVAGNWLCVCVSAVVGTGALAAWYFHSLPLYFILANIPVGIVLPFFIGGGVLLLLLNLTPFSPGCLVDVVERVYEVMEWVAHRVAGLPGAAVGDVYFHWWLLLPYYGAVFAAWYGLRKKRPVFGLYALMLSVFAVFALRISQPGYPEAEAYAMRYRYATVVLLREGDKAMLLTDAPERFHDDMRERISRRLTDYMGRRGVGSLEVVNGVNDSQWWYADSGFWVIGNTFIALAGREPAESPPGGQHVDYALVTAGFNGDVENVWRRLHPDTVVLSPSLHPSRIEAYKARLLSHDIPFRVGLEGMLCPCDAIHDKCHDIGQAAMPD